MNTRATTALQRVFIQPDIRRRRLTITIAAGQAGDIRLHIDGTDNETRVRSEDGGPVKALLEFPEFECWSPEKPMLYTLVAEPLEGNAPTGPPVHTRFGMREFTVKERRFALNNRPCVIRAAVLPSSAAGIADGSAVGPLRAAGFNMLQVRGGDLGTPLLDACDEAGLFLWYEPPPTVRLPEGLHGALNHPSLVMVTLSEFEQDPKARIGAVRAEDPSRVLVVPPLRGRTASPACMVRPYHDTPEPFDNLVVEAPRPFERAVELHYQHNGSPDRLVVFGEAGMSDLPGGDGAATAAFHARGLEAVFGTPERFQEALTDARAYALRMQLDAMRTNSKAAGYCMTLPQVFAAQPETSPLRQSLRLAQVPLRMVIECDRTNISPRDEVRVRVTLINDRRVEGRADLSIQVVGPTKQVLWKKRRAVRITKAGAELWAGNLAASGTPGEHQIVARLMQGMNRVAETSIPLYVTSPPVAVPIAVALPPDYPAPNGLSRLVRLGEERAPVYLLPRLANTVRAYPPVFVSDMLGEVAAGAVGFVLSPPMDWNDLAGKAETPGLALQTVSVAGGRAGFFHYGKRHPIFEELPARGLLGAAFRNILPGQAFLDESEQDIAGCLDGNAAEDSDQAQPWRSSILVKRFGEGRLVFTHFPLLEHLDQDPVAARMLVNAVSHFASRAVPAEELPLPDRSVLRWLTQEQDRIRRWMVLGMFPNFGEAGHDTAYPPEEAFDPKAVYPGWYNAISWKRWYSLDAEDHVLDLEAATAPGSASPTRQDYGTAYAYAEFSHPHREAVSIHLADYNAVKCWLNGRLVFETRGNPEADRHQPARVDAVLRQGKNTVLLKVSKTPGPVHASINFESQDGRPLTLRWWR